MVQKAGNNDEGEGKGKKEEEEQEEDNWAYKVESEQGNENMREGVERQRGRKRRQYGKKEEFRDLLNSKNEDQRIFTPGTYSGFKKKKKKNVLRIIHHA